MTYDLAILGGGPAGVAAGVYAARKQLKTLFITKDWNGQSAVSDGIGNWIGTIKISGIELARSLKKHLEAVAGNFVDIHEGESVTKVVKVEDTGNDSKPGQNDSGLSQMTETSRFRITTSKGSYGAETVLIATGSHRKRLEIPGADRLEHKGLTYCASCDGPLFAGQDVAVIGSGNAAFESAAQLLSYCKSVTLFARSDKLRADPSTIEAVSRNPHFKIINNAVPKEIKGEKFVSSLVHADKKTDKDAELSVSGIFVEIGSLPTTEFVKNMVKLDDYNRIIVDPKNQRASLPGIWAAGDCANGLYHQNNIAAGDAVKALEDIYNWLQRQ